MIQQFKVDLRHRSPSFVNNMQLFLKKNNVRYHLDDRTLVLLSVPQNLRNKIVSKLIDQSQDPKLKEISKKIKQIIQSKISIIPITHQPQNIPYSYSLKVKNSQSQKKHHRFFLRQEKQNLPTIQELRKRSLSNLASKHYVSLQNQEKQEKQSKKYYTNKPSQKSEYKFHTPQKVISQEKSIKNPNTFESFKRKKIFQKQEVKLQPQKQSLFKLIRKFRNQKSKEGKIKQRKSENISLRLTDEKEIIRKKNSIFQKIKGTSKQKLLKVKACSSFNFLKERSSSPLRTERSKVSINGLGTHQLVNHFKKKLKQIKQKSGY